jgi:hypothetical protein
MALKYPEAPSECFVTAAELICLNLKLKYEAVGELQTRREQAKLAWDTIKQRMEDAYYRNWKVPDSSDELLKRCNALKYLWDLGDDWKEKIAKSLTKNGK